MTGDTMLPIIRQMLEADDDQVRARILLRVPDAVLGKFRPVFEQACRRTSFDLGLAFIDIRRAEWNATRGPDGQLTNPLFAEVRAAFAEFAGVAS